MDLSKYETKPKLKGLLEALNNHQLKVAMLDGGNTAVCGVAGSGKTAALIALIARKVFDGESADRILAMTFTKAAAEEMNKRLAWMEIDGARVGTIHSVAYQILRESGFMNEVGFDSNGRLYAEMNNAIQELQRSKKVPNDPEINGSIRQYISRCKMSGAVHVHGDWFGSNSALDSTIYRMAEQWAKLTSLYARPEAYLDAYLEYEKRRANTGLIDYDDMICWAWLALVMFPKVRDEWVGKWSTVIVDEGQDSSALQWDISRLLVGMDSCILAEEDDVHARPTRVGVPPEWIVGATETDSSLVIVGAPSQAIYGWRGAAPSLFLEYADRGDVELLRLPVNYRSAPGICVAGSTIGRGQTWNIEGEMEPVRPGEVGPTLPAIKLCTSAENEADSAVTWAMERAEESGGMAHVVVMSRTALGLASVEIECIRRRIPYRKMASSSFFDAREVSELLAYIRVACGLDMYGKDLRKVCNVPFRYLGKGLLDACQASAEERGDSLLDALNRSRSLKHGQRRSVRELTRLITALNKLAIAGEGVAAGSREHGGELVGPAAMIAEILNTTNYREELKKREGWTFEGSRTAIVDEFQRIAEMFLSPVQFVKYMEQLAICVRAAKEKGLQKPELDTSGALTLTTIHRAKGLEWKHVWITGVQEGHMPHGKSADSGEELRLFYVAVTRAADSCVASFWGNPSKYLQLLGKLREEHGLTIIEGVETNETNECDSAGDAGCDA